MKFNEPIDHKSRCKPYLTCPRCGRPMCDCCITTDLANELPHNKGHKGECLICSGMHKRENIILHESISEKEARQEANRKPYKRKIFVAEDWRMQC